MDAITSYSSAKLRLDNRGVASKCGGTVLPKKELAFSRSQKVFSFRVLRSPLEKRGPLLAPGASSSSSNAEAGLETAEDGIEEAYPSKTVNVRFQLKKECQFGEQFLLVGDDPMLGSWDPSIAIPMNWSDGNVWTLDVDIPVERQIQFKFILKGITGIIQWQPDPDRALKTWETNDTITVYEDWEDATLQRITEGETLSDSSEELTGKSEMPMVADNLSPPMDKVIRETENGSVLADTVNAPAEISLEKAGDETDMVETRSPLLIVAENIAPTPEKLDTADNIQTQERIGPEEKYGGILNKETAIPEDVPKNNRDKAAKSTSTSSKGDLVTFDEGPVLVPGLTPLSMALAKEEPVQLESKTSDAADVIAKDPKVPELEEIQEPGNGQYQQESATAQSNHEEQLKGKWEEVPREDDVKEEENVHHAEMDGFFRNDIQWGRRTLQNFLANLGLLL